MDELYGEGKMSALVLVALSTKKWRNVSKIAGEAFNLVIWETLRIELMDISTQGL